MANVKVPYADPGRASFEVLDTYTQQFLLAGNHPELAPAVGMDLPNNCNFAQFSVLGIDTATKKLAMATEDGTVKAQFVLAQAASLGATGSGKGQCWYSGNFNIDALVWDASFDTDAKKSAAFNGAPTPTTILCAKRG